MDRIVNIMIWYSVTFGFAIISNVVIYAVFHLVGLLELIELVHSKELVGWWILINFMGSILFFFLLFRFLQKRSASHLSAATLRRTHSAKGR